MGEVVEGGLPEPVRNYRECVPRHVERVALGAVVVEGNLPAQSEQFRGYVPPHMRGPPYFAYVG